MFLRLLGCIVLVLGIVAVLAFFASGRDPIRECRHGPRWKRRLLTAGLAVLAAVGVVRLPGGAGDKAAAAEQPPLKAGRPVPAADANKDVLAEDARWRQILAVLKEAEEIADLKNGNEPFANATAKKLMKDRLARAAKDLKTIAIEGRISSRESKAMQSRLAEVTMYVGRLRDARDMATCYSHGPPGPMRGAFGLATNLKHRVELLEKLVTEQTLHVEVVRCIVADVEADIEALQARSKVDPRVKETVDKVESVVKRLRARIGPDVKPANDKPAKQGP